MRNPEKYTAKEINDINAFSLKDHVGYIPARPLGWQGFRLFKNIKLALFVFIGKYDALDWEE